MEPSKVKASLGQRWSAKRMAPLCVVRFNADPNRGEKLKQLREVSAWCVSSCSCWSASAT